jgi:hypothetical protein
MLSRSAPGPSIVIAALLLLKLSCPCVSVIVAGVLASWKSMVLGDVAAFASAMA